MGRRFPRPAGEAVRRAQRSAAPATLLGRVQTLWPEVVGAAIASAATPVGERRGELRIRCESAVWAQELDLMSASILARLNEELGEGALSGLKFEIGPAQAA